MRSYRVVGWVFSYTELPIFTENIALISLIGDRLMETRIKWLLEKGQK